MQPAGAGVYLQQLKLPWVVAAFASTTWIETLVLGSKRTSEATAKPAHWACELGATSGCGDSGPAPVAVSPPPVRLRPPMPVPVPPVVVPELPSPAPNVGALMAHLLVGDWAIGWVSLHSATMSSMANP